MSMCHYVSMSVNEHFKKPLHLFQPYWQMTSWLDRSIIIKAAKVAEIAKVAKVARAEKAAEAAAEVDAAAVKAVKRGLL